MSPSTRRLVMNKDRLPMVGSMSGRKGLRHLDEMFNYLYSHK